MIILGIDPALVNTGIALIRVGDPDADNTDNADIRVIDLALIVTAASDGVRKNYDDYDRACYLRDKLYPWVDRADLVAVEIPQVGGSSMSSRSQWSSGIMLGALVLVDKPMVRLTPKEVRAVTGNVQASKEEMCEWAYGVQPDAPWPARKLHGAMTGCPPIITSPTR